MLVEGVPATNESYKFSLYPSISLKRSSTFLSSKFLIYYMSQPDHTNHVYLQYLFLILCKVQDLHDFLIIHHYQQNTGIKKMGQQQFKFLIVILIVI